MGDLEEGERHLLREQKTQVTEEKALRAVGRLCQQICGVWLVPGHKPHQKLLGSVRDDSPSVG